MGPGGMFKISTAPARADWSPVSSGVDAPLPNFMAGFVDLIMMETYNTNENIRAWRIAPDALAFAMGRPPGLPT